MSNPIASFDEEAVNVFATIKLDASLSRISTLR